jgi:L-lactate dehydrogenase
MAKPTKVVIIGAGSVGVTTAYAILLGGLVSEIVLIDVDTKRAEGEAADLGHAAYFSHTRVRAGTYEDCAGAVVVIITAGVNQKAGQTRMELREANHAVLTQVIPQVAKAAPDTILIIATNPVDVLTHAALRLSGFPPERVIGTGTALDTTRFCHELGKYFCVNPNSIHAMIIGEHGDTQLPVWSLATISGMRFKDYALQANQSCDKSDLDSCFQRTRDAAYEIIKKKGKTNYGIASVLMMIITPIINDENAIMIVSRVGTYAGVEDVALGMPCRLNRRGAFLGVNLLLDDTEEEALHQSAMTVKSSCF